MNIKQKIKELNQLSLRYTWGNILLYAGLFNFFFFLGFPPLLTDPLGRAYIFLLPISLLSILIGIYLLYGTKYKYKNLYKQIFIEKPLEENFDDLHYDWTSGFSEDTVISFDVCRMGNGFYSEDLIQASYQGVTFEMSDVTVKLNAHKNHPKTIFQGRILVIYIPDNNINSVHIMSETMQYMQYIGKKSQTVDIYNNDFNQKFIVKAINPHDAYNLLTPHSMELITDLNKRFNKFIIHARGNKLVLALNDINTDSFDSKKICKRINYQKEIAKINKEIDDIKAIINIIRNLDTHNVSNYYVADTKLGSGGFIIEHTGNAYKSFVDKIL